MLLKMILVYSKYINKTHILNGIWIRLLTNDNHLNNVYDIIH